MSHNANGSLEIVDYFRRNSVENQNYPVEKFKNALWKTFGIFGEKSPKNGNASLGSDASAYWLTL